MIDWYAARYGLDPARVRAKNSHVRLAIMYDQAFWQEPPREEEGEEDEEGRPRLARSFTPSSRLPQGKMVSSDVDGSMVLDMEALAEEDEDAMDRLFDQLFDIPK